MAQGPTYHSWKEQHECCELAAKGRQSDVHDDVHCLEPLLRRTEVDVN